MNAVLVLNADLGPLHRVSLRHAIRMLLRQVAVIHEADADRLIGVYPIPRVVRLVTYVVTRWRRSRGPAWSRRWGAGARRAPVCVLRRGGDHRRPPAAPSRGGENSWLNTVAACGRCNQRKGDRTPAEASMRLLVKPFAPTWAGGV